MLTACKGELPNPYKYNIRKILDALIARSNDFSRVNIQLRNTQDEYKNAMRDSQFRCVELQRRKICGEDIDAQDKTKEDFQTHLKAIDEMNECFCRRIEHLKSEREETVRIAKECLVALSKEKCRLKAFHENTIDYLQRFIQTSGDTRSVRQAERDLCQMQVLFTTEVFYIKKCEEELQPFLKQIEDCDTEFRKECCCFQKYDWMAQGHQDVSTVGTVAENIKKNMGKTLVKAFAQMHIQRPDDPSTFLAAFFKNLDRIEKLALEKGTLFGVKCEEDCREQPEQECQEELFANEAKC